MILHVIYNHVISQTNISPFFLLFHPLYSSPKYSQKMDSLEYPIYRSKVRLLQPHTGAYTFFYLHFFSFLFSQLVFRNAFFVYTGPAALRCTLRARALTPTPVCRCGNTGQPYTYNPHVVYTAYIFDICVRACCGASVCVSAVERGLLLRVPSSPRGGLLGGRRWSSRERTVASRRLDGERGRIVQHVTAILLGRERLRGCNLFPSSLSPPPPLSPTFHPEYSCVCSSGKETFRGGYVPYNSPMDEYELHK